MNHIDRHPLPSVELLARPGTHRRTFTVTMSTDLSRYNPAADTTTGELHANMSSVLDFYAAAVGAGCFGDAPYVSIQEIERRSIAANEETGIFTLELLPLPLEAVKPLLMKAHSANAFGARLTRVIAEEQSHTSRRPERIDFDALAPLPPPWIPFPMEGATTLSQCRIVARFGDAVSSGAFKRMQAAFEAWAGMLSGGFEGTRGRFSTGRLEMVSCALNTEVVVALKGLDACSDAWNAMARVLETIDREVQAIERVEITPG